MKFIRFFVCMFLTVGFLGAEVLKIGTNPNFPPFEFIDSQNKITGFDIDLIDAISKKVGFEYEILTIGFDGLIPALKAGKIDMIVSGMSATEARKKVVDFTDSYYTTENLFIKRVNDNSVNSLADLQGKKIGVQLGTVQELAARAMKGIKTVSNQEIFSAIISLKEAKVDAVLVDSSIGYGYIKKNPDLVAFFKEKDGSDGFSMAFDKNKHTKLIAKINSAIDELKKDGTYDRLLDKYDLK